MPPQTINDETLNNAIVDDDSLLFWDKSAGVQRRVERGSLLGTVARTDAANTFTLNQTISKVSAAMTLTSSSGGGQITIGPADNGNSIGSRIILDRNTNATTPAAGHVRFINRQGTAYHVWPDNGGDLRIGTSTPTSANDTTTGVVVGTQTSHESFKTLLEGETPIAEVLARLAAASAHVHRFEYRHDAMGMKEETFEGLVLREDAPETHYYGTDKYAAGYSAGKCLNMINLCGDLLRAVVHLHERVAALESQQGGG